MNIHNHSIWPPPGAFDVNRLANAARHGALPPQSMCTALIVPAGRSPDAFSSPFVNLLDKG